MDKEEILFRETRFVKSAVRPEHYPEPVLPEVAVLGRSNVGKSALLNSLFNRKGLVKVSGKPGHTQLVNFFEIDHRLMLVDLPGYGFAKVPKALQRRWKPMIERYLKSRDVLVGTLLLLDIRRLPSEDDLALWEWLHAFDFTVIPVLTKCDKFSKQKQRNQMMRIAKILDVPLEAMVATSSKTHQGREQLRRLLSGLAWQFQPSEKPSQSQ